MIYISYIFQLLISLDPTTVIWCLCSLHCIILMLIMPLNCLVDTDQVCWLSAHKGPGIPSLCHSRHSPGTAKSSHICTAKQKEWPTWRHTDHPFSVTAHAGDKGGTKSGQLEQPRRKDVPSTQHRASFLCGLSKFALASAKAMIDNFRHAETPIISVQITGSRSPIHSPIANVMPNTTTKASFPDICL